MVLLPFLVNCLGGVKKGMQKKKEDKIGGGKEREGQL